MPRERDLIDLFIDSLTEELIDTTREFTDRVIREQMPQAPRVRANAKAPRQPKPPKAAKVKRENRQTHYDTLEVHRAASQETIAAAYRSLCQRNHPDKYPNDAAKRKHGEERTKAFTAAYAVLKDPTRRREYDKQLAKGEA